MTTERPAGPPARWTAVAAACSAGAGLVHAAAAGAHGDDRTLVRLFALTAVLQGAGAAGLLLRRSRVAVLAAVAVNGGALAAWALSRTTGLPVIDALADAEPVGRQDLLAAGLAAGAAVAGLIALTTRVAAPAAPADRAGPATDRLPRWVPVASALVLLPAFAGVVAPHGHGDQEHAGAATSNHAHTDAAAAAGDEHAHGGAPAAPAVLAGADTSTASPEEIEAAVALVESTRAGSSARLTTTAAAEAAGYVWIGDGRRPGGYQHYVHRDLLLDGRILDPDVVESLVFQNVPGGPVLVSAMYLLEPGSTMADVPDVAGDLTVWHDHQNLCWDETGQRLAGVVVNGTCRPGGEPRATTPMLHVWLADHECGPFAGVEGHPAGSCGHGH